MKVTDWRRKLAASLVAGRVDGAGRLVRSESQYELGSGSQFLKMSAASLAVIRPPNLTVGRTAPRHGFAYTYGTIVRQQRTVAGRESPSKFWTLLFQQQGGQWHCRYHDARQVSQNLTFRLAPTATQIGSGEAAAVFSAYFSSYAGDG